MCSGLPLFRELLSLLYMLLIVCIVVYTNNKVDYEFASMTIITQCMSDQRSV